MENSFWREKKVFITGHTGFKGGWLSLWLQHLGANVTGFSLAPPTIPNLFESARLAAGMASIFGDVRDLKLLTSALQQAEPEIVIHMAAQPLVLYSYENPVETYSTNILGTVNILEAVRQSTCVKAVVNVTSDKCYENREWMWGYRENERLGGRDPYSSSKACSEIITSAYRDSYFKTANKGVAIATARAGNVIGGGDWAVDRLIPDFFRAQEFGKVLEIRNPLSVRPWQHVLEPLSGYLMLAQYLYQRGNEYADAWNFGPAETDTKTVRWVVDTLVQLWDGSKPSRVSVSNPRAHEAQYLRLDCSKANTRIGWAPRWKLPAALSSIVDWHKAFQSADVDMRAFSLQQISEFNSINIPER